VKPTRKDEQMNPRIASGGIAGVLVLGAGAVAMGAMPADGAQSRTIHLTGTVTSFEAVPQRPDGAPQRAGDQTYFVTHLTHGRADMGDAPHHCVAVDRTYTLCSSVADLPGGQLTMATSLEPTTGAPTVAVTGGTGDYAGASGQVHITYRADGSQSWILTLSSPHRG
jgi:hypothetical protein